MAKSKPIVIKSGQIFRGHGYDEKVKPFEQPAPPPKKFDPKKNGSIIVK
jgi:hypothetical protein